MTPRATSLLLAAGLLASAMGTAAWFGIGPFNDRDSLLSGLSGLTPVSGPEATSGDEAPAIDAASTDAALADRALNASDDGSASPGQRVAALEEEGLDLAIDGALVPSFDVVRVEPDGRAVIAGRAAPNVEVEVKVGEKVLDRVNADARGEWVSLPTELLAPGDQELSLNALNDDNVVVPSDQVVVIKVPVASNSSREATTPVVVALDRVKGGESRVLQAPGSLRGGGELTLGLLEYDRNGAIRLSGDAPAGAALRIYVDNQPITTVNGDEDGQWTATIGEDLAPGTYTLRLDQLDAIGQAVARLETPLTRVGVPPAERDSKVDFVVVQPGNSLWRIARRLSGDGFNYVYIFDANKAQIRDPDVIYPGQVFEVPSEDRVSG